MTLPAWHEESVAKRHDRRIFDCGVKALNEYLVRFARQNHQAGLSKTFVAVSNDHPRQVLGYYSVPPKQWVRNCFGSLVIMGVSKAN